MYISLWSPLSSDWELASHSSPTSFREELLIIAIYNSPKDGGAWWDAVCGVAQSRTRLKRLSSSSSSRVPEHFEEVPCNSISVP